MSSCIKLHIFAYQKHEVSNKKRMQIFTFLFYFWILSKGTINCSIWKKKIFWLLFHVIFSGLRVWSRNLHKWTLWNFVDTVFLIYSSVFIIFYFIFRRIWNTLTENYGNVMPVNWKTSHTRSLHLPTLNLGPQEVRSVCPSTHPALLSVTTDRAHTVHVCISEGGGQWSWCVWWRGA